jgi:glycosyltransferase involved in cell wall biosynthesis
MVIATKFPSYVVKHPHKVVWLVHQHRQAYDLYGTPYGNMSDSPADSRARQMVREIDNRTLGEARRIFTIAQNTTDRLAHYNGIKAETLYHPPKLAQQLYHQSYGDYVFSPSRLDPTKRIHLLIEALAHVKSQARCIISGTGPETAKLQTLAQQLGVSERVEFVGFVSDERLLELYANCFSVFYAPYNEDYGYVTLEAFNARKPVITASDSGGVLEFVENERSGYICYQGEPARIAARIDQLYAQRDLCQKMGNVGYEKVLPICWDDVIAKLTAGIT